VTRRPARSSKGREGGSGEEGGRRPRYVPRKRSLWKPVLGVVIVLVVAGFITKLIVAVRLPRSGQDLPDVARDFVEAWGASDLDEIASFHPTEGRAQLRRRLDTVAGTRGWSQLPEPTAHGTAEGDGRTSLVVLQLGSAGEVTTTWSLDPIQRRWWMLDLELPTVPLGDLPERFSSAWSRSDPAALAPFFRDDTAEKMGALVERETAKRGWERWPALGTASIMLSATRAGALDASHAVGDGVLRVRWAFHEPSDRWVVSGFDFP
jgi:hypothetical protein